MINGTSNVMKKREVCVNSRRRRVFNKLALESEREEKKQHQKERKLWKIIEVINYKALDRSLMSVTFQCSHSSQEWLSQMIYEIRAILIYYY